MSWLQKIAVPIKITPSMNSVAEKCLDYLFGDRVTKYDKLFYEDIVYDKTEHPFRVAFFLTHPSKSKSGALADAQTPMWQKQHTNWFGRIGYMLFPEWSTCDVTIYDTIPPQVSRRELKAAILHELVHCVDPKLNKANLFNIPWYERERAKINSPNYVDSPAHYTSPWEQDAFMSSEAYDQVAMWKRNGVSLERALEELRHHLADNPREKEWKKDPKLWQRFMRAMYQAFQDIYTD